MEKYKSFINSITVDINPVFHDVLYIIEYIKSGRHYNRYIFHDELLSYDFSQRIHNFISTGILVFADPTITTYKYGFQNVIE